MVKRRWRWRYNDDNDLRGGIGRKRRGVAGVVVGGSMMLLGQTVVLLCGIQHLTPLSYTDLYSLVILFTLSHLLAINMNTSLCWLQDSTYSWQDFITKSRLSRPNLARHFPETVNTEPPQHDLGFVLVFLFRLHFFSIFALLPAALFLFEFAWVQIWTD